MYLVAGMCVGTCMCNELLCVCVCVCVCVCARARARARACAWGGGGCVRACMRVCAIAAAAAAAAAVTVIAAAAAAAVTVHIETSHFSWLAYQYVSNTCMSSVLLAFRDARPDRLSRKVEIGVHTGFRYVHLVLVYVCS